MAFLTGIDYKCGAYLSSINEKEANRKEKGVYYTPHDIVEFMIVNATKHLYGKLKENNLHHASQMPDSEHTLFLLNTFHKEE